MRKTTAIRLLGGSVTSAAQRVGCTVNAVCQWPEVLPRRIEDRVVAAWARQVLPREQLEQLLADEDAASSAAPTTTEDRHEPAQP